jgi:FK506-binding protein 1
MGVTKTTTKEGSGAIPQKGDTVCMEYTGYLKDTTKPDNKGEQYVVFLQGASLGNTKC